MSKLDKILLEGIKEVPFLILKDIISRKMREANITVRPEVVDSVADAIRNGICPSFEIDCGVDDLTLHFGEDDIAEIEARFSSFAREWPEVFQEFIEESSASMLTAIRQQWDIYRPESDAQAEDFRMHVEKVWGGGFNSLRVLHEVCKDVGHEYSKRFRRSKAKKNRHLRSVISRLHARACQVTGEIIVLMENGYADGAMARWRTLHEITAVASVISEGGDCLAERYIDHDMIEVKKGMEQYEQCRAGLGYEEIPESDLQQAREAYDYVLKKYGKSFKEPFGWAVGYIGKENSNPKFSDIEEASGRALMRSHYKLASYNVHASYRALSYRLGCPGVPWELMAGPTDVGFEEPAQNAAISLMQVTCLLFGEPFKADDVVKMKVLLSLSGAVSDFIKLKGS